MIEKSLKHKRILVVEDNSINQLLVKHILKKTDATLDFAEDGKIALQFVRKHHYDLILMDLQLPEMDGYETTYFIRNEINSSVPIIAMTAMLFAGEENKCFNVGMNGYLIKPFTIENFFQALNNTIAQIETNIHNNEELIGDIDITIDLSVLKTLAGDDKLYMKTIVQTFLDNMPATIEQLNTYCNNEDWVNLAKTAHFAKSSLSVIKIKQLLETVQSIEWQCRHNEYVETLPEKIEYINANYTVAKQYLESYFEMEKEAIDKPNYSN